MDDLGDSFDEFVTWKKAPLQVDRNADTFLVSPDVRGASPLINDVRCFVVPLRDAKDAQLVGTKAFNLGRLLEWGFRVPDGVVVVGPFARDRVDDLVELLPQLVPFPVAVRSSSVREDLANASYAGIYESVLNVQGRDGLKEALLQCWASGDGARAKAYDKDGTGEMAVVVQRMLAVQCAGVAFSANPVTGARDEVLVSAVPEVGEALVGGTRAAEEWVVKNGVARRTRQPYACLTEQQAEEVAQAASKAEHHAKTPQDIEWAYEAGVLWLLQCRPITALPDSVSWTVAPELARTQWMRNFRIGEWLQDPVSPLFESLLPVIESRMMNYFAGESGLEFDQPYHVICNGWYYFSPSGNSGPAFFLKFLLRRPQFFRAFISFENNPDVSLRLLVNLFRSDWEERLWPAYKDAVERGAHDFESLGPQQLLQLVREIAGFAGEMISSLAVVGGSAWKIEGALAKFYSRKLPAAALGSYQPLLRGCWPLEAPPGSAVYSIDPIVPTFGEMAGAQWVPPPAEKTEAIRQEREQLEAACRAAITSERVLQKFEHLLALAREFAKIRETQVVQVTHGWPLLRRALLRLASDHLRLNVPDHVFFLSLDEIERGQVNMDAIEERMRTRERHSRLQAPLYVGKTNPMVQRMFEQTMANMRDKKNGAAAQEGLECLEGCPASPGRFTGPCRIIRGPQDFAHFRAGEVLVAQTTSPVWTPLFVLAGAVVTNSGSVASHASLVAREYGIPAVVAVEGAVSRLCDGQMVTVDGGTGKVIVLK